MTDIPRMETRERKKKRHSTEAGRRWNNAAYAGARALEETTVPLALLYYTLFPSLEVLSSSGRCVLYAAGSVQSERVGVESKPFEDSLRNLILAGIK